MNFHDLIIELIDSQKKGTYASILVFVVPPYTDTEYIIKSLQNRGVDASCRLNTWIIKEGDQVNLRFIFGNGGSMLILCPDWEQDKSSNFIDYIKRLQIQFDKEHEKEYYVG